MATNIRLVSSYDIRCGLHTFTRDLATALKNLTGEVNSVSVAANDPRPLKHYAPVDLSFDRFNPKSWDRATGQMIIRAFERSTPTTFALQHEYGLDPGVIFKENGTKEIVTCMGDNYVKMARKLHQNPEFNVFVYLHTVLGANNANEHQVKTLQQLAENSDGLIVTTSSAKDILCSAPYNIPEEKLEHIDHGIRENKADRLEAKRELGAEGIFLATQLGLRSPDKGVQYSVEGTRQFVTTKVSPEERKQYCTLIAGEVHPEFKKAKGGEDYRKYMELMSSVLNKDSGSLEKKLNYQITEDLSKADFINNDVIIYDNFVSEELLLTLYGATNTMLLPYLNMDQISSGILADTIGSGRIAISTKFMYAQEMLDLKNLSKGLKKTSRGICIDYGRKSSKQICDALTILTRNKAERSRMEEMINRRGSSMSWDSCAKHFIDHDTRIRNAKQNKSGRGVEFKGLRN